MSNPLVSKPAPHLDPFFRVYPPGQPRPQTDRLPESYTRDPGVVLVLGGPTGLDWERPFKGGEETLQENRRRINDSLCLVLPPGDPSRAP